jgi:PTS system nitrogen regulatory IIA component
MNFSELITTDRVLCCPRIGSKKRLLESISELLARNVPQHSPNEIFDSLISREKLGSTGLGKGVAIPHGRLRLLARPACAFIKLDKAVEFDAPDGRPVDLICALIVPEESTDEHLQILSSIATLFGDQAFCGRIRGCGNETCLYQQLSNGDVQQKRA